jgi:hypothetical protein
MRVLLAACASYVPPRGGATRSNLVWLDHLAAAGHECRIVAGALAHDDRGRAAQLREEGIAVEDLGAEEGVEIARRGAIQVWSVADPARRAHMLGEQIRTFWPDWVLVSSEDLGNALLREAHQHAPGRVIYLAHTPQFYPFGPESWNPDARAAELVRRSAAVVAIGNSTAAYIERHLGRTAEVTHPPIAVPATAAASIERPINPNASSRPWYTPARADAAGCSTTTPQSLPGTREYPAKFRLPSWRYSRAPLGCS